MIKDGFGRSFKKLRISLTHQCNYACVYCSENNRSDHLSPSTSSINSVPTKKPLSTEDLLEIVKKLNDELHLSAIRLTGGEPMLHPGIENIVNSIQNLGITNIGMTTNGHLFYKKAKALHHAGLKSVNISIDALSANGFKQMSRSNGLPNVLKSIDEAIDVGLSVKLNSVIVAGQNDDEILPLLEFALNKGVVIRFLELMSMGPLHNSKNSMFFSKDEILKVIGNKYQFNPLSREENSTADYWSINGEKKFGIIANDSSPFCGDCNRLRLDSYGNLFGCLSSLIPIAISKNIDNLELKSALKLAISHKQQTHFIGNKRTMQSIGG